MSAHHEEAAHELLLADPTANLFLLGMLDAQPPERGWWYGVIDGDRILALVSVVPKRLAVPFAPDPSHARLLGSLLHPLQSPTTLVGPREACDALWQSWAPDITPDRAYDQRLYIKSQATNHPLPRGFRLARAIEWPTIAALSAAMQIEDLGQDPTDDMPAHLAAVQDRIQAKRSYVIEEGGEIVFLIHVGTQTAHGAQVGGTFVPPEHRGRGFASAGMRAIADHLLQHHPVVTLHVNEANLPAVGCYERAGFVRHHPFRLITGPAR